MIKISLYINDITTQVRYANYHMYAVSLQIYQHFPITESVTSVSQENYDIDIISSWAMRGGLKT